jgi:hypothetical protein
MSNETIRPTSIVGIKRLARNIKGERGIPHHEALNVAARQAGFESFRHAQNRRPGEGPTAAKAARHRLYLTGFWKDRDSGARGRETTWVDLSLPWSDLVTSAQMRNQRSLVRLVPEAADHFSYQYMFSSQSEARSALCAATRTFQFMDATKLRPTRAHSRVYPGGTSSNAIPGRDHSTSWYEPESKTYVFADEPYELAAQSRAAERDAWARTHDYAIAKPNWPGMYNPGGPGGSRLYLTASTTKGPSVSALAAALDKLPAPMLEETWQGESVEGMQRFKSPAELAAIAEPRPTPAPKAPQTRSAETRQPRPGRMPIEVHEEIGRKLREVMAHTYRRSGVHNRLDRVRSELDDWIQREYDPKALPMERFSNVYYGDGPRTTFARSLSPEQVRQSVEALDAVEAEIERHYTATQCKTMLSRIDQAIKSLQTWTTAQAA